MGDSKAKAEQIAAALAAIANGAGNLTPEAVVEAARESMHPLHDEFDWDDTTAGHAYRVIQARQLIRSVRVEVTTATQTISTVYYVRNPLLDNSQQGYVSLPRLRSDKELTRAALAQEFGRAAAVLARARSLAAVLAMLENEIDAVIEQVALLEERVGTDE